MQFLFDLYPNLKALWRRKVPEEIDEKTFWAQVSHTHTHVGLSVCVSRSVWIRVCSDAQAGTGGEGNKMRADHAECVCLFL